MVKMINFIYFKNKKTKFSQNFEKILILVFTEN